MTNFDYSGNLRHEVTAGKTEGTEGGMRLKAKLELDCEGL